MAQDRRSSDLLGPGVVRHSYDEMLRSGELVSDPAQLDLVRALDDLARLIASGNLSLKSSSLGWLFSKKQEQQTQSNGLYIWGGVGRGKTALMDIFYSVVDVEPKRRVHFNDFLQEAHELIYIHREKFKHGKIREEDPIPPIAKCLANKAKLLCFDEFAVNDIADAMLLARLFTALFSEGVVIVATSNVAPHDLYKDGQNRQLFLPFIELLSVKVKTHELLSEIDYRRSKLSADLLFNWPLNQKTKNAIEQVWTVLSSGTIVVKDVLQLKGREIRVDMSTNHAARFQFDQLCREPRSAVDYLAIAHRYSSLVIENIPILLSSERNEARRFTALIDVLYDNSRYVVFSADGPPESLFQGESGKEVFEFERTVSRLIEMQSLDYSQKANSGLIQDLQAIESFK